MALVTLRDVRTPAHGGQAFECGLWQLQRGQKWLVLGNNGAGKTMFANVVAGRQVIARGERSYSADWSSASVEMVSFERQNELHASDDRFDDSELRADANDPGTLVHEFLGRDLVDDPRYQRWLRLLGLEHIETSGLRGLSTGEMRKVLLAKAVLANAPLLILDDPLAGLDKSVQQQMKSVLAQVFEECETVLLIGNRIAELSDLPATNVMVLESGVVHFQGPLNKETLQGAAELLQGGVLERDAKDRSVQDKAAAPEWPPLKGSGLPENIPLFELHDVSVSFGDVAIFSGLNWVFRPGQHAHISGPNGCGKSTLLNLLSGENAKAYGQGVTLFGRSKGSGESIWELRRYFGVVSTSLQRQFARGDRVLDVVLSGFQDSIGLSGVPADTERELAQQWLDIVGAQDLQQLRFRRLSYGQQKLVLIARAMVKQPAILILDEPCIGLDDANRRQVLEVVDAIAANSQTHILFVSHLAEERPACINQTVQFEKLAAGEGYKIKVEDCA